MFQLVDSFFFISLGITFVLLFLMAFHFKNRVSTLEKKYDTLSDMCKTIVSEIGQVKNMVSNVPQMPVPRMQYNHIPVNTMMYTQSNEITDDEDVDAKDQVEYNYDDESEGSEEFDAESEDEAEEDDSESDEEEKVPSIEHAIQEIESDDTIEVHKVHLNNSMDEVLEEGVEQMIEVTKVEEVIEAIEIEIPDEEQSEAPSQAVTQDEKKVSYKKMNVQMLRTLVISKGLCTDPSKMKKQELLKMLTDYENEE